MPRTGAPCIFFFNDTATTEIYPLSRHDALPIYGDAAGNLAAESAAGVFADEDDFLRIDRKSTRLNSSHLVISYVVFCLIKKIVPTGYTFSSIVAGIGMQVCHTAFV